MLEDVPGVDVGWMLSNNLWGWWHMKKRRLRITVQRWKEGTDNVSISYFRSSGRYLIQKAIFGMLFRSGVVLALSCQYVIVLSFFSFAISVAVSRTSQSGDFGSI